MLNSQSKSITAKSALIVQGGAMRSVFSAGVLDAFLEKQFNPFDYYIGVSAGATNLAAFLGGEPGVSLRIFQDFAQRAGIISYCRFFRGGHLIDHDRLFALAYANLQLNLAAIYQHGRAFYICVTDVSSGQAIYVQSNAENLQQTLRATTAIPVFYRSFPVIHGQAMTDGGVADPIPVARAIALGARQIMVVRSRPQDYVVKDSLVHRWLRWQMRTYPQLQATMRRRVTQHKEAMQLIRNPPAGVNIIEVCPPGLFSAGRFSRKTDMLQLGYQSGREQANTAMQQWQSLATVT